MVRSPFVTRPDKTGLITKCATGPAPTTGVGSSADKMPELPPAPRSSLTSKVTLDPTAAPYIPRPHSGLGSGVGVTSPNKTSVTQRLLDLANGSVQQNTAGEATPPRDMSLEVDPIPPFMCHIPSEYNSDLTTHLDVCEEGLMLADEFTATLIGPTPAQYAPIRQAFWPTVNGPQWADFPAYADAYNRVTLTGLPNRLGARITLPSGLNLQAWEEDLVSYHDKEVCEFLRYGWPVGYTASHPPVSADTNPASALPYAKQIQDFVDNELALGGVVGPFPGQPFVPWTHTAPIITQPKRDSTDRRIILDLSHPEGSSVNAGITKNCFEGCHRPYTLPSVEDLATRVQYLGPSCFVWKADMARAYRQLRTDVGDLPLLGFKVNGLTYIDLCPSFGCRLSSMACQRTTAAVTYLMRNKGFWTLAYLDDFVGVESSRDLAEKAYRAFNELMARLGLALAQHKCFPPATAMEWLGFYIDTDLMILSVPDRKLKEVVAECTLWMNKTCATKKQIQSLVGKLVHISKCVLHARRFICRILDTLRLAPESGSVPLSVSFKADVKWFKTYAQLSNGVHLLEPDHTEFNIECDSSLKAGGGNTDTSYYTLPYSAPHCKRYTNITQLEAVNLLTAYRTLKPQYTAGLKIVVYTDNMSSASSLRSGRTKDPALAACSRQLWLEAAVGDHVLDIRHKPGAEIPLADALSRYHEPAKKAYADAQIALKGLTRREPALPHPFFTFI